MRTSLRQRIARLAGWEDLTHEQVARLSYLAGLHDVGKYNVGFQRKGLPGAVGGAGHVAEVIGLFGHDYPQGQALSEAMGIERLLPWTVNGDALAGLLISAISHHGRPVSINHRVDPRNWDASGVLDPMAGVRDLAARLRVWFPEASDVRCTPFPDCAMLQHVVSGLVTLADWIGSDTCLFAYSESTGIDRMPLARAQALQAVHDIGLDTGAARRIVCSSGLPPFCRIWPPHSPRPVQQAILDLQASPGPSVTIVESETGSGKTEAAVLHFLRLLRAGAVDGMYFALPTRTSAVQIHARIVNAVRRVFAETAPPVVLAVPGYLRVDEVEGQRLAPFDVLWPDSASERSRHRGWAAEHPKRYLAAGVVVGTIDQVLLSTLAVRHSHMRAVSLLRHLLVVDEVHASDSYMTRLLEKVLQRHCRAGGQALLMSATLGGHARARLASPLSRAVTPHLPEAIAECYPLVLRCEQDTGAVARCTPLPAGEPKRIRTDLSALMDDPSGVADCAVRAARKGARVIVLRNTVRDALATQEAVEAAVGLGSSLLFRCEGQPAPHHARFSSEDREALDRALEEAFGKRDRTAGGLVVVATQTIQQSLDLDADFMITDLCPMDVLLQRLGRLHRHVRPPYERPAEFGTPRAVIVTPAVRDLAGLFRAHGEARGAHGLGTVYGDLRIIEATWRQIESRDQFRIPDMNRELVERTTHPEALDAISAELGDKWADHGYQQFARRTVQRQQADLNLADWTRPFGEYEFPSSLDDSTASLIKTRLGEGDRLVRFADPPIGPFGSAVHVLTVPAFLAPPVSDDEAADQVRADEGTVFFTWGGRDFVYDRLGFREESGRLEMSTADKEDNA